MCMQLAGAHAFIVKANCQSMILEEYNMHTIIIIHDHNITCMVPWVNNERATHASTCTVVQERKSSILHDVYPHTIIIYQLGPPSISRVYKH